jgi:hypothetical protein
MNLGNREHIEPTILSSVVNSASLNNKSVQRQGTRIAHEGCVLSLTAGGSVEVVTVYSGIRAEMCNVYTVRERVRFLNSPAS